MLHAILVSQKQKTSLQRQIVEIRMRREEIFGFFFFFFVFSGIFIRLSVSKN